MFKNKSPKFILKAIFIPKKDEHIDRSHIKIREQVSYGNHKLGK
jgi:hypothetical protein